MWNLSLIPVNGATYGPIYHKKACKSMFILVKLPINIPIKWFFCLHQVFDSKESLSTAAECVKVAKEHCQQLTEIGLDLTFTLQSLLVKDIKAGLQSYNDIIIEATKHRNSEEMWRRMNLMTPEALVKLKVGFILSCSLRFVSSSLALCVRSQ